MPTAIQLDAVYSYQCSAIAAVQDALCQTHGRQFAYAFIQEHRTAIQNAVNKRLCGRASTALSADIKLLRASYRQS